MTQIDPKLVVEKHFFTSYVAKTMLIKFEAIKSSRKGSDTQNFERNAEFKKFESLHLMKEIIIESQKKYLKIFLRPSFLQALTKPPCVKFSLIIKLRRSLMGI